MSAIRFPLVLRSIVAIVLSILGCGGVGVKRRIAEADAIRAATDAASSSTGPVVKKRPAEPPRRGGIKHRIDAADEAVAASSNVGIEPTRYWNRLKREWAKGKMSSKDVQGHALDAMASGARGVAKMATPPGPG